MKKIAIVLFVVFLILWTPYFIQTYNLKTLTNSDLPLEGAWASLEEGNLYYRWYYPNIEVAKDEVVVLVHGFSTPHFVWDGMKGFLLDAGYSILVFDHFGRGFSERPKIKYTKDVFVQSLRGLLDSQEISKPVHLVGYSMGGAILGHFTEAYPQRVATMSLIAPAGFMTKQPASYSLINIPLVGEWLGHMFADKMLVSDITETEMAKIDDPLAIPRGEFVLKVGKQMQHRGFVESLVSTLRHFNLFNALGSFNTLGEQGIPTLAIWGTDDATVPFMGSENLLLAIPHAELIAIEDGGHNITYMQPSIVGPAIVDFVNQNIAVK